MKIEDIRFDCRYYKGYKPCGKSLECVDCSHYEPRGTLILLIKLGAMGDVLRTTPILFPIKKKYPQSYITWLTDPISHPLLVGNSLIDRLLIFRFDDVFPLLAEKFDMVINLEKEQRAIALADIVNAQKKVGFALTEFGTLGVFNKESEYSLMLGLSDDLKFNINQKSYQQIAFEMLGLDYKGEEYILELTEIAQERAHSFRHEYNLEQYKHVIGVHTGSGSVFRTKQWTIAGWADLINELLEFPYSTVVFMGGAAERNLNREVLELLGPRAAMVIDSGCTNTVEEFTGIMSCCELLVGLDSLAMHVAIGLKKKVVALFGPTCHQEIDFYGRGTAVVAECNTRPCYRKVCSERPHCMEKLTGTRVAQQVKELLFPD